MRNGVNIESVAMQNILRGRRILLGVTGSVAIYKSLELIRELGNLCADVRVVMSEEAKTFISPLLFEALSKSTVLHGDSQSWSSDCNHIGYASWCEMFILAPASANSINKISHGIADNILLSTILALPKGCKKILDRKSVV